MSSSDNPRRRRRGKRPDPSGQRNQDRRPPRSGTGNRDRRVSPDLSYDVRDTSRDLRNARDVRDTSRDARNARDVRDRREQNRRPPRSRQADRRPLVDRSARRREERTSGPYRDGGFDGYGGTVYAGEELSLSETRLAVSRRNTPAQRQTDLPPARRQEDTGRRQEDTGRRQEDAVRRRRPGKRLRRRRLLPALLLPVLVLAAVLFTANRLLFQEPVQQTEPIYAQEDEPERVSSMAVIPEELRNLEVRENLEQQGDMEYAKDAEGTEEDMESDVPEPEVPSQESGHKTRKEHFFTFLMAGTDDNNGGSDTIILVALDAIGKRITGISLPRDTKAYVNDEPHKLNYAYRTGGMSRLAKTVSRQLGIPIDYTVEVDLNGFAALVDAIGGVDFYVPINMDYDDPSQNLYIGFYEGMQHLNGADALKVVRFRHNWDGTGYGDEDLGRMRTQQNFLKAVAKKMLTPANLTKVGKYVKIFQEYIKTDLDAGNMAWLAREAISIGADGVEFTTLPGEWKNPYIYLDRDKVLTTLNEMLNPYEEPLTSKDLHLAK